MTLAQLILLATAFVLTVTLVAFGALALTLVAGMVRASLPGRSQPCHR